MNVLKTIDHTLLKNNIEKNSIENLCKEAIQYGFYSVMVHPSQVKNAKSFLKNTDIMVGTVISFPFGEDLSKLKAYQTQLACNDGADEIDMVACISKILENDFDYVKRDIEKVREACSSKILKVIIETCFLNNAQIEKMCECCVEAKADFVKTSTGVLGVGANMENIKIMKNICKDRIKIKASGGIKNLNDALLLIDAGADRIGTSSGCFIAKELEKK